MNPMALSWSGGKDSALALWVMRSQLATEPTTLITTFTADYGRVSMHGVRRELIEAQARAHRAAIGRGVDPSRLLKRRLRGALRRDARRGGPGGGSPSPISSSKTSAATAKRGWGIFGRDTLFPLWGRDTAQLAHEFIDAGL